MDDELFSPAVLANAHMQALARVIVFAENGEFSTGLSVEVENLRDWLNEMIPELQWLDDWGSGE